MYEEVKVLTHSSIRITGEKTIYFDPYNIRGEMHDADMIFVTHDHYDHFSPEDILKIEKPGTILVCPASMEDAVKAAVKSSALGRINPEDIVAGTPGDKMLIKGIPVAFIPSYNIQKPFHPQRNQWVGYVVIMNGTSYYVAGDTDNNEDVQKVECDVALLPAGGTYTMNYKEAAALAEAIAPKLAIPTHYGSIAGKPEDGQKFAALLKGKIETRLDI